MTHAMVITAVHLHEATGKVERYRVENSWEEAGVGNDKGFMVMSDDCFARVQLPGCGQSEVHPEGVVGVVHKGCG